MTFYIRNKSELFISAVFTVPLLIDYLDQAYWSNSVEWLFLRLISTFLSSRTELPASGQEI